MYIIKRMHIGIPQEYSYFSKKSHRDISESLAPHGKPLPSTVPLKVL